MRETDVVARMRKGREVITASKYHLARACPAAFRLPWTDERTPEATAGTELHAEYERRIKAGDIPHLLEERWPGAVWDSEISMSSNARLIAATMAPAANRDYPPGAAVAGTADAIAVLPDRVVVVDFKSFGPQTPPKDNAQLHMLALLACAATNRIAATVAIHHELHGLSTHDLDVFDLEVIRSEVIRTLDRVAEPSEPVVGSHCRYCPAFHACPKQGALVRDVEQGVTADAIDRLSNLDDDATAMQVYEFAKRCRMLLKRLDARIAMRARQRPIPLRDGATYGVVVDEGNDSIDGDIAWRKLEELHGAQVADAATERYVTKASIKRALATVAPKGALASMERGVIKAIKDAGGITNAVKETLKEHK